MFKTRTLLAAFVASVLALVSNAQTRGEIRVINGDDINPAVLSGDRPEVGSFWQARINTEGIPGQGVLMLVSSDPWPTGAFTAPSGQILIDPSRSLLSVSRPIIDNLVTFGIPVPNDPSIVGENFYVQSLIFGRDLTLTNGLALTMGDRTLDE